MYVLDTDVLSRLMRPLPPRSLITRLGTVAGPRMFTSSISLGELVHGAYRASGRTSMYLTLIEEHVLDRLTVLPFDVPSALIYGRLRADLDANGTPIGDADTRIASIALANDMIVVTANMRHFARVPELRVENWMA